MRERGYPVDDFEQQAADVSVDHPEVVEHYREAHAIHVRAQQRAAPRTFARRWSTTARSSPNCSNPRRETKDDAIDHEIRGGHRMATRQSGSSTRDDRRRRATRRHADEARPTTRRDAASAPATAADVADDTPELLPRDENADFQRRWEQIQTGFVDEPRQTVEQADELVAQVMQRLAEGFAAERERLEQQWGRGEDVSTEDLRIALQRYRGFFQRLLSA